MSFEYIELGVAQAPSKSVQAVSARKAACCYDRIADVGSAAPVQGEAGGFLKAF